MYPVFIEQLKRRPPDLTFKNEIISNVHETYSRLFSFDAFIQKSIHPIESDPGHIVCQWRRYNAGYYQVCITEIGKIFY